jgi:3-carboxy-cis,cis-muconate cycloisomerase
MPFHPADSKIFSPLFSDPEIASIFSDEQYFRHWLDVEAALALSQGELDIIPMGAAQAIEAVSATLTIDMDRLRDGTARDGFPIIELVRQLRQTVGSEFANYVHYGVTTQDIMDTALVLQIRLALQYIETQLQHTIKNLAVLADRHQHTLMAGRTHSQLALPITFGYKVAGWLAPLLRHRQRLQELKSRVLVLQLGGAAGTLASFDERGVEVQSVLAKQLELDLLPMPWHTQRDGLAELANWLSLVTGSLGKMAQDIILLAQNEVGEVRESTDLTRGGSSAMPQKSNPITSELILALAKVNSEHLATMHQALIHEHERGTHAWQVEWLTLPQMFAATAVALGHATWLGANLSVNEARMSENIRASQGVMLAEAITTALTQFMPQAEAKKFVSEACQIAMDENKHLIDVILTKTTITLDWDSLRDEAHYLGSVSAFIEQVLKEARTE